jgi:hypothetical protein
VSFFEIVTTVLSLVAVIVSLFTAYKTFTPTSKVDVYLRSRAILSQSDTIPCLIIGFDISNSGSKAGAVEDITLVVKYIQKGNGSINRYSFIPYLTIDEYNILKQYAITEFQGFNSILVPANTRMTKHIIFLPSNNNFLPEPGEMELKAHYRLPNEGDWKIADGDSSFPVDDSQVNSWKTPGKSVTAGSASIASNRESLMKKVV